MKAVELQNISFNYSDEKPLFNELNLSIHRGDFSFVIGPNGSGKSTLIKLISGQLPFQHGNIRILEKEHIYQKEQSRLVGYVPQSHNLDPDMKIEDLIRFMAACYSINGKAFVEIKDKLVHTFSIEELLSKKVKTLSGGQKQTVNIILGLIHQPEIVLLDEPFVGLDYTKSAQLISTLKNLHKTIICVSHDIDLAEQYADMIILMNKGQVLENNSPKEMIDRSPFGFVEIELKKEIETTFSSTVFVNRHQNQISLSFPWTTETRKEVDTFIEKELNNFQSVKTTSKNLKSSVIGLHHIELKNDQANQMKGKKKKK